MNTAQDNIHQQMANLLLQWYAQNKRMLPFRTNSTPYRVWVSEIMLQQTRIAAAMEHYNRFMEQLPTVQDLADCPEEKLLKLWEGLGYYSRARNLQKAAKVMVEQYGGELPADYKALLSLPGIGEYTAGAIASISFGLPVAAVDGNVLRVFARLYDDHRDVLRPAVKRDFTARVLACQPRDAAGDYNQALMELGALVCLPGSPQCLACPASSICRGYAAGTAAELPVKTPPKARRIQPVTVLLVQNARGEYLLQQRPKKGLLAGLWQPLLADLRGQYVIDWRGGAVKARYVRLRRIDSQRTNYASVRSFEVNPLRLDNLGFTYMGPFDGHNVKLLEKNLRRAMVTNKSVVFHVKTIKGKGYAPAEDDKTGYWHGASPFDIKTGLPKNTHPGFITYSHLFADLTLQEMGKHEDSVLIVPAMMKGSQQDKAFEAYKDRCFDVGIQEEHALTFAGALALNGYHPIVDIYSTFLQRAYDELLHDCARLNIKMTLLIDRAGFVGKDGETHHGIFDSAYLSSIPGITLSMPSTKEIAAGLYDLSFKQNGILGIRYSREALLPDEGDINPKELNIGDFDLISKAEDEKAICLCVGPMGREFAKSVNEYRKTVTCIDPIFISPLSDSLLDVLLQAKRIFVYDPYSTYEGFCSQVSLSLARNGYGGKLKLVCIPKGFYQSDAIANQMKTAGVDVESAMSRLDELLED